MSNTITVNSKEFNAKFDRVRKATAVNAKWNSFVQLFNLDGSTLKMICGNSNLFSEHEMDCVATGIYRDDEMMKVAVNAVALSKCLSKKGETVFSIDGEHLVVESDGETARIQLEEFIEHEIDNDDWGGSDSTAYVNFSETLKTLVSFSSLIDSEFRPQLCHLTFTHDGERVKMFATDLFRLVEMHQKSSYTTRPFAIDKDHANIVADVYKGFDFVHSRVNDAYVIFAHDGIITYVKTANNYDEGVFLPSDYSSIFENFEHHKPSSFDAVKVAKFIKERKKINEKSSYTGIKLESVGSELTATLYDGSDSKCPTRVTKTPVESKKDFSTSLDQRYAFHALTAIGNSDFELFTVEPNTKIMFRWGNNVSILMPMVKER